MNDATFSHELPNAPADDAAPVVPGYELGDLIGRGGMGDVYRARDLEMDREVAVKVLQDRYPVGSPTAARFVAEARITGQLQHPGIPAVYRVAALADGRPFLAMKLIKGRTLDELVRANAPLNHLAVIEAVAQALGYAHAHDVIHRDLKPHNVMVGPFGEVQLMDWGLAKVLTARQEGAPPENDPEATTAPTAIRTGRGSDHTQPGSVLGTPAYMAPEQAAGETHRVGRASDVFGLGALWCKLLTGQPPFTGADAESVRRKALRGQTGEALARLAACGAEPEVVALCRRCLAVEPEDRPADANEVARRVADLRVAAEERARQAELDRARAAVQAAEQARRRRTVQRAGAVVAAVLLVGLAGTGYGLYRANEERLAAREAERIADEERDTARAAERIAEKERVAARAAEGDADRKRIRAEGAEQKETAARQRAEEASEQTLAALDVLVTEIAGESLASQPGITADQKAFLTQVLPVYRKFASHKGDDERTRHRIARTAHRVGVIEYRLGRMEESRAAFEEARAAHAGLVAEYPAVPKYRQGLAASHNNLGLLLCDLGDRAAARAEYSKALALLEKLAAEYPAEPAYRQDLAASHNNLGIVLHDLGDRAAARAEFGKALAIQEKLAAEYPAVPACRQELARSHNNLGIVLRDLGERAAARAEYAKAVPLLEKLAAEYPVVPAYRQELAGSHYNLGNLLRDLGERAAARAEYAKAVPLLEKLAAEYPAVPKYRQELARSHNSLGVLLRDLGERAAARAEYAKAVPLLEKLAADFPELAAYRQELAVSHYNLGLLLLVDLGDRPAARAEYAKALALREKLAAEYPAVPKYRQYLASSHYSLGALLRDLGDRPAARAEFGKAVALQEKLAAEYPAVPDYRQTLASIHYNLGNLLRDLGNRPAAGAEYAKAVRLLEKLAAEYPAVPKYRQELARSHNNLGIVLSELGERPAARAEYGKALALREKLVADFPAVPVYRVELGGNYCNIGDLMRDDGQADQSLDWFGKAIAVLRPVHDREPRDVTARLFLRNSFWNRALAHNGLAKYGAAVADWDQAIALTSKTQQPPLRLDRAQSLVQVAGKVAEAVAEVEELAALPTKWRAGQWYDFACVYALAAARSDDKKVAYADRAMELLHRAVQAGFTNRAHMEMDTDLDALRARADFKKLIERLPKAK